MAQASATDVFNCTIEEFFKIISDYSKYPEFLPEVKGCKVIEDTGAKKRVEYNISLIKTFTYSLWMSEKPPQSIVWEFAGGDLFKVSKGSWALQDEAGKTRATYTVEVDFKTFVPGPVAKTLIQTSLPNMMSAYHKRVSEIYGK